MAAFIWVYVLIVFVALFWIDESYAVGSGEPFVASIFLFLVVSTSSAVLIKSYLAIGTHKRDQ